MPAFRVGIHCKVEIKVHICCEYYYGVGRMARLTLPFLIPLFVCPSIANNGEAICDYSQCQTATHLSNDVPQ